MMEFVTGVAIGTHGQRGLGSEGPWRRACKPLGNSWGKLGAKMRQDPPAFARLPGIAVFQTKKGARHGHPLGCNALRGPGRSGGE